MVPQPAAPTIQASDIEATEVRAQTIYANKIKAPMVQGTVHQSDSVKIKDTKGDIKAPSVSAGEGAGVTVAEPGSRMIDRPSWTTVTTSRNGPGVV